MGIGAVGASSAGGTAGMGGHSGGGSSPVQGSASSAGKSTSVGSTDTTTTSKDVGKVDTDNASKSVVNNTVNINQTSNFNTKDFMSLRNTSKCHGVKKSPEMDMKKLIEMMIMIQMMKKLNEVMNPKGSL